MAIEIVALLLKKGDVVDFLFWYVYETVTWINMDTCGYNNVMNDLCGNSFTTEKHDADWGMV